MLGAEKHKKGLGKGTDLFINIHYLLPGGPGKPVRLGPGSGLWAEIVLRGAPRRACFLLLRLRRRLFRILGGRLRLCRLLLGH